MTPLRAGCRVIPRPVIDVGSQTVTEDPGMAYDGRPYIPGVNCADCGRFVGRDGVICVEYFEMSSTIASVDGTCARCLEGSGDAV